ncbi:hypothetical protein CU098_011151 [Rhizopus stolonifer]|uniref:Homeobox domain-containing protein n=1 Tax=Rhizopus stolonifer TaxID=4846 RepID=A0A367KKA6_RHIST|nr:hypothetical protein CU098_011151 [Rhizopus stolonifer]
MDTDKAKDKSQAVIEINRLLEKDISNLNKHHHSIEVDLVDIHSLVDDLVVDPIIFGYKHATGSIVADCGKPCSSADEYVWLDDTRFSTGFHKTIATSIVESESFTPKSELTKEPTVRSEKFTIKPSKGIIEELVKEYDDFAMDQSNTQVSHILEHIALIHPTGSSEKEVSLVSPVSPQSSQSTNSPSNSSCDMENVYDDLSNVFREASLNAEFIMGDEEDLNNESPVFLVEILRRFPDLPSFIVHSEFPTFSRLWLNFQKYIILAKEPERRYDIQTWLKLSVVQIGSIMVSIAKAHLHSDNDLEIVSRSMFSAFRQLKDHMELVYEVFQIIENGRVWFNQNPLQAIAPLIENLVKLKQGVEQPDFQTNTFSTSSSDGVPQDILHDQTQMNAFIYDTDYIKTDDNLLGASVNEQQVNGTDDPNFPFKNSLPHSGNLLLFSSALGLPSMDQGVCQGSGLTKNTNLLSEDCPSSTEAKDNVLCASPDDNDIESFFDGDLEFEDYIEEMEEDDDDEYVDSDKDNAENIGKEEPKSRVRRTCKRKKFNNRYSSRRTATSYDEETTHYLKSIFYDIYSVRSRLTKEQRKRIEKETGLKPRNITYWFSNHKRRFQHALEEFKQVVKESNGQVKTYGDFLDWQKAHCFKE